MHRLVALDLKQRYEERLAHIHKVRQQAERMNILMVTAIVKMVKDREAQIIYNHEQAIKIVDLVG